MTSKAEGSSEANLKEAKHWPRYLQPLSYNHSLFPVHNANTVGGRYSFWILSDSVLPQGMLGDAI